MTIIVKMSSIWGASLIKPYARLNLFSSLKLGSDLILIMSHECTSFILKEKVKKKKKTHLRRHFFCILLTEVFLSPLDIDWSPLFFKFIFRPSKNLVVPVELWKCYDFFLLIMVL